MTILQTVGYPTPKMFSMIAGEDLSSYQYCFVKAGSVVNTVEHFDAATDVAIGILMNAPVSGQEADIAILGGGAKLKCDNTVTNGALIAAASNGSGTLATTGKKAYAKALPMGSTTASNDVIPCILVDGGEAITQAAVITAIGTTTAISTTTLADVAADVEARLDAIEVKVDEIITKLKASGAVKTA